MIFVSWVGSHQIRSTNYATYIEARQIARVNLHRCPTLPGFYRPHTPTYSISFYCFKKQDLIDHGSTGVHLICKVIEDLEIYVARVFEGAEGSVQEQNLTAKVRTTTGYLF
jgi:hypothetical protein